MEIDDLSKRLSSYLYVILKYVKAENRELLHGTIEWQLLGGAEEKEAGDHNRK